MASVTFDTNIFTHYPGAEPPGGFVLSSIVVLELIAGAADGSEAKRWAATFRAFEAEGRAIVPLPEDYITAGHVLFRLQQRRRAANRGKTPPISKAEVSGIMRDVLIAVTAKRAGAIVVTENLKDFERIRPFYAVRYLGGEAYFGRHPGGSATSNVPPHS